MRTFEMTRSEMSALSPELVQAMGAGPDGAADVSYFLAVAVLPGCEAIPMHVEADPDAIRLWMENSLLLQARALVPGRPARSRAIRGRVPVPAVVASLVHALAWDEIALDPAKPTLNARLAARLSDPSRDPAPPEPAYPSPSPFAFR
jgi:hypothetical protein